MRKSRLMEKLLMQYEHEPEGKLAGLSKLYELQRDHHQRTANTHSIWIVVLSVMMSLALIELSIPAYYILIYGMLLFPAGIIIYHYFKGKNAGAHHYAIEIIRASRQE